MSLVKIAFLGMHWRKLGPKERQAYIADNEKWNKRLVDNPIAKGVYSGVGGVIGGSAGAFSQLGKTPTRIALGLVGGAALGGALGYGVNRGDNRTHQARIALMKDKNKEWLVFGKGKSHLDNE